MKLAFFGATLLAGFVSSVAMADYITIDCKSGDEKSSATFMSEGLYPDISGTKDWGDSNEWSLEVDGKELDVSKDFTITTLLSLPQLAPDYMGGPDLKEWELFLKTKDPELLDLFDIVGYQIQKLNKDGSVALTYLFTEKEEESAFLYVIKDNSVQQILFCAVMQD